jgi:hypothetical protein
VTGEVSLNWTNPASNNETGFTVQYIAGAAFPATGTTGVTTVNVPAPGVSNVTVTGLVKGTAYSFRVAATNKAGTSVYATAVGTVIAP